MPAAQPDSLRSRLLALDPGESVALAERHPLDDATSDAISQARTKLHDTGRGAIGRASRESNFTYTGELGSFLTNHGNNVVLAFVITRTQ